MTTILLTSSLKPSTKARMGKDLMLGEKKSQLCLFRLQNGGNEVVVPYYYGKMLAMDQGRAYDDMEIEDHPYMPINQYSQHRRIEYGVLFDLFPHQAPVLREVNRQVRKRGAVCLKAATAFGKSIAIVYTAGMLKYRTLVYATAKVYINQLADAFRTQTNAVVWVPTKQCQKPPDGVQVILVMPKRIKFVPQSLLDTVGTVIVDEAHLICTPEYVKPLFLVQPRYFITTSATITAYGEPLRALQLFCGSAYIDVPLETPLRIIKVHTGITVPIFPGPMGPDWTQHREFIANHEERNRLIVRIFADIMRLDREADGSGSGVTTAQTTPSDSDDRLSQPNPIAKALESFSLPEGVTRPRSKIVSILANIKDHLQVLPPLLEEMNLTWDYVDADRDKYHDCDVLLGVDKKLGTGFDQKASCLDFGPQTARFSWVVPFLDFAKEELYTQVWGRACRSPVAFILFFQDRNNIVKSHWTKIVEPLIAALKDVEVVEIKRYPL